MQKTSLHALFIHHRARSVMKCGACGAHLHAAMTRGVARDTQIIKLVIKRLLAGVTRSENIHTGKRNGGSALSGY